MRRIEIGRGGSSTRGGGCGKLAEFRRQGGGPEQLPATGEQCAVVKSGLCPNLTLQDDAPPPFEPVDASGARAYADQKKKRAREQGAAAADKHGRSKGPDLEIAPPPPA